MADGDRGRKTKPRDHLAAAGAGDADGLEQAYAEARRAARTLDDEPQSETTALYRRLRRSMRTAGRYADAPETVGVLA